MTSRVGDRLLPNWAPSTLRTARMPVRSQPGEYVVGGREFAKITIYSTDGKLICRNQVCANSPDPQARSLHEAVLKTYTFFRDRLNCSGIDGRGEIAPFTLHWEDENAAWMCHGTVSCQSCSWSFNDRFVTDKIVTHEWTHGVIARLYPLADHGEAAALNEAIADKMAIFCYLWNQGGDINNDRQWQIEGIRDLTDHKDCSTLEILRPGETPDEDNDFGHVHENSRVMSHAYYCAVKYLLGDGMRREVAFNHALNVLWGTMKRMVRNETFDGFALKAIAVANERRPGLGAAFAEAYLHVRVIQLKIPKAPPQPLSPRSRQTRPQAVPMARAARLNRVAP